MLHPHNLHASLPSPATPRSADSSRPLTRAAFHAKWAAQALQWRQDGITKRAKVVERILADLALVEHSEDDLRMTLVQAAGWSGYSADHLGRLVRTGHLTNYGRKNAPLVRRGDLPRKPGHLPVATQAGDHDRERIVRAAVSKFQRK